MPRALVLSLDAMTGEDLRKAQRYPHFARLLEHCALATQVLSVFPSLTYPCHVSMVTGCTPDHTGVWNNERFLPDTFQRPWYFYTRQIGRPTIFDAARKAGVTTGCVMWPCMGKGPIDTLVPEIWGETPASPFLEPFCQAGTERFIRDIWPVVGHIPHGFQQPMFDDFVCQCAVEVILRKQPELLYVHMCSIDNAKHYCGLNSPGVEEAIAHTDQLLGRLIDALAAVNLMKETAIVLCSDHGQQPVERISYPNRLLASEGLLEMTDASHVKRWQAQVQSACLSALLYTQNEDDLHRATALLHQHSDALGIAGILPAAECARLFQTSGTFSAVLLGTPGTLFHNDAGNGPLLRTAADGPLPYRANHGHDPRQGEKPFFLISGKAANPSTRITEGFRLADEPVTIAAFMGIDMPQTDGRAWRSMLR